MANVTDKTYTFTGLQPATNYTFEVLAVNDQGRARSRNAAKVSASTTLSMTTEGQYNITHKYKLSTIDYVNSHTSGTLNSPVIYCPSKRPLNKCILPKVGINSSVASF